MRLKFLVVKSISDRICGMSIYGVWRHRCGQVKEMDECVCLESNEGGGQGSSGSGVCPNKVCVGVHTKTDAYRHGPASFPPDRLSSAQE